MNQKFKILTATLAIAFSIQAKASDPTVTKDIVIAVNEVFVPGGFDSRTEAYVVVSGLFPNGCYKWKGAILKDQDAFTHDVTSVATVSQGMCIQVLVPFSKEVKLGHLSTGTHLLHFLSNDGTYMEKKLVVE